MRAQEFGFWFLGLGLRDLGYLGVSHLGIFWCRVRGVCSLERFAWFGGLCSGLMFRVFNSLSSCHAGVSEPQGIPFCHFRWWFPNVSRDHPFWGDSPSTCGDTRCFLCSSRTGNIFGVRGFRVPTRDVGTITYVTPMERRGR